MTEPNYQTNLRDDDDILAKPDTGTTVREGSALERLAGALAEDTKLDKLRYKVPNRKSLRLILDPNIEGDKFQAWQRKSRIKTGRPGGEADYDAMRLACTVVGNALVGLEVRNGKGEYEEVFGDSGEAMTLYSPELKAMLTKGDEVVSAAELVKRLFGNDGHLLQCSSEIITAAGYGEDSEEDDDPSV